MREKHIYQKPIVIIPSVYTGPEPSLLFADSTRRRTHKTRQNRPLSNLSLSFPSVRSSSSSLKKGRGDTPNNANHPSPAAAQRKMPYTHADPISQPDDPGDRPRADLEHRTNPDRVSFSSVPKQTWQVAEGTLSRVGFPTALARCPAMLLSVASLRPV